MFFVFKRCHWPLWKLFTSILQWGPLQTACNFKWGHHKRRCWIKILFPISSIRKAWGKSCRYKNQCHIIFLYFYNTVINIIGNTFYLVLSGWEVCSSNKRYCTNRAYSSRLSCCFWSQSWHRPCLFRMPSSNRRGIRVFMWFMWTTFMFYLNIMWDQKNFGGR